MGMLMRGSLSQVMVLLLIGVVMVAGGGHGVKEYDSGGESESKKNMSGIRSTSNSKYYYGGSSSCVGLHCLDDHVEAYDSLMEQHDDQLRRMLASSSNTLRIVDGTKEPGKAAITCLQKKPGQAYTTCSGDGKGSPCKISDYNRVLLGKC